MMLASKSVLRIVGWFSLLHFKSPFFNYTTIEVFIRSEGASKPGNLIGSCVRDPVSGALEFD